MVLEKVTVKTESYYPESDSYHRDYRVVLEIPLPGGKAVYELPISKDVYENLNTAAGLAQ